MATTTADQRPSLRASARGRLADPAFAALVTVAGVSVLVILAWMIGSTAIDGWPVFVKEGLSFFTSQTWDPGTSRTEITGEYGAAAFIYGTVVSAVIALLIAVPLSTAIALYLNQLAPSAIRRPLVYAVELLAAIPSVVYGLWGALFFVPTVIFPVMQFLAGPLGFLPFIDQPIFQSITSFSVVLSIMILPIITAVSREVIATVPRRREERRLRSRRDALGGHAPGDHRARAAASSARRCSASVARPRRDHRRRLPHRQPGVDQPNIFGPASTIAAKIAVSFGRRARSTCARSSPWGRAVRHHHHRQHAGAVHHRAVRGDGGRGGMSTVDEVNQAATAGDRCASARRTRRRQRRTDAIMSGVLLVGLLLALIPLALIITITIRNGAERLDWAFLTQTAPLSYRARAAGSSTVWSAAR